MGREAGKGQNQDLSRVRRAHGFLASSGAALHNGSMDILSLPEFIYRHNQIVVGSLMALILLTGIVFLWRMINEKPEAEPPSTLDVQVLEDALKRVLSHGPLASSSLGAGAVGALAGGDGDAGAGPVDGGRLRALAAEREEKVAELQTALERAKPPSTAGVDAQAAAAALELQGKVRELETRLEEYSIIEDDIADLSMYKEENQRLKSELDELRTALGKAPASAPAPSGAVEQAASHASKEEFVKAGPGPEDDVMKQFAEAVSERAAPKAEAATTLPDPLANLSEAFDLRGDKSADSLAAGEAPAAPRAGGAAAPDSTAATAVSASVGVNAGDPLAGALDTSKMLEEVASLDHGGGTDDALAEALDTDKLLLEVSELSPPAAGEPAPGEDLFGEFKDEETKE